MADSINIFLVDDHHVFRDGIKALLVSEIAANIVGEAENGNQVLDQLLGLNIDVMILDIDMPGLSGIEVMKKIGTDYPNIAVLVLSSHDTEQFIYHMMKNGASGYLLKSCKKDELVTAIQTINNGGTYLNKTLSQKFINYNVNDKESSENTVPLSAREIEVLKLVALGLTNQEIGSQLFISHRTVDTHRRNMMTKLDLHNAVALTRYAAKNGLLN